MDLLLPVLLPFALALLVPWLHRPERTATEWLLALVPLAVAIYLASKRLRDSL